MREIHSSASFLLKVPALAQIYTLSLHDALPISGEADLSEVTTALPAPLNLPGGVSKEKLRLRTEFSTRDRLAVFFGAGDRKSTRLNSSHRCISYAVFCLKKKNKLTPVDLCYSII